jgi:Xaa-Pro aminopeptidase
LFGADFVGFALSRVFVLRQGSDVAKRSKYGNRKTVVDGITFDSIRESKRFGELSLMQEAGLISGLELQQSFDLIVNGMKICRYVADFVYTEKTRRIVEDVKGVKTPSYTLKKKLMLACHGITIRETR